MDPTWAPDDIDPTVPSAARTYDYLLGGSHNFAVDREAARRTMQLMPDAAAQARENRAFLHRVVRYLLNVGVRQFLDIGSGIPTVGNVHEVAQRADPGARVVYVDIDPIAVAHTEAILANNDRATVVQADLRQPHAILEHPQLLAMLDLDKPVGLLLIFILHAIPDREEPHSAVYTLRDGLTTGSHLAITHLTGESEFNQWEQILTMAEQAGYPITLRDRDGIGRFFAGLELVEPGLVKPSQWRSEDSLERGDEPDRSNAYAGVGRVASG